MSQVITILVKYNNREIPAFLLAIFNIIDDEFTSVKGFLGRIKYVSKPVDRQYCLVFIPWKHQEKELALIPMSDIITIGKLAGNDIVSVEKYISPFTEEYPYYSECKISNFVGYNFVYDYKNFISDVINQCFTKPLTILYQQHPEFLYEEFDEDKI